MAFCLLCSRYGQDRAICTPCSASLRDETFEASGTIAGLDVTSLFPYRGVLRQLCLRVKVQSEVQALGALMNFALAQPQIADVLFGIDAVAPVPSSLWSRCRGRIDIAGTFAHHLARAFDVDLAYPPVQAYLRRWKKRSMVKERSEAGACDLVSGRERRLLIVDDIVTSGYSLAQMGRWFPRDQLSYLTLFRARG